MAVAARRGLDSTSSLILHEVYLAYPNEVTFKAIGKKLKIVEKTIQSSIRRINNYGVPIEYKTDKAGIVHASVCKVSFSDDDLIKNTNFLINELKNKKPESSKGIYLKKIFINTTMGPGLQVDPSSAM